MKEFWIIFSAILLAFSTLYLLFIVGPVIVSFFAVFREKRALCPWEKTNKKEEDCSPYWERMRSEAERLAKRPVKRMIRRKGKLELVADYYPGATENTLVLCHGFHAHPLANFAAIANESLDKGYNVFLPFSRAHLPSRKGRPSLGILEEEDLREWIDSLFAQTNTKKIVLWGISMGCATVSYASDKFGRDRVKGMILDCGFASPYDQYGRDSQMRHLPWRLMLPVARLVGFCAFHKDIKTTVRESLKKTTIPALFLHGEKDLTVPIAIGRENYESCASQKEFIAVPEAAHALSYEILRRAGDTRIDRFIETCFKDDTEA